MPYLPHKISLALERLQLKDQSFFNGIHFHPILQHRYLLASESAQLIRGADGLWNLYFIRSSQRLFKREIPWMCLAAAQDQTWSRPSRSQKKKERETWKYWSALGKTSYSISWNWMIYCVWGTGTKREKTEWDNVLLLQCRIQFVAFLTTSVEVT